MALAALGLLACGPAEPRADAGSEAVDQVPDTRQDYDIVANDVDGADEAGCEAWAAAAQIGVVDDPRITELSGLARSRRHPQLLWAHNDSGEQVGRVFALSATDASVRGVLTLPGVKPRDWEDLAAGPCAAEQPASTCLWIGDIGDNGHSQSSHDLLRVAEPVTPPVAGTQTAWTESPAVFSFRYPDDARGAAFARPDAEALAALPDARLLVLTKRDDGRGRLFRVTPQAGKTAVAVPLGLLDLRDAELSGGLSLRATAADLDPTGRWLFVRTYFRAYRFDVAAALASPSAEPVWAVPRAALTTGFDIQGESLAEDGAGGVFHGSELADQPLWHVPCAP